MSTTVVNTGGGGGKSSGGSSTGLYIALGGMALLAIVVGVIVALGASVYKCEWGMFEDESCTEAPTTGTPTSGGSGSAWPGCSEGKGDPDASYNLPNNPTDPADASAKYKVHKDGDTAIFWADGCGWCDAAFNVSGKCYANADGTGKSASRRRIWNGEKWEWCNWENGAWAGNDACAKPPLDVEAANAARRVRRPAARTRRRSAARKVVRAKAKARRPSKQRKASAKGVRRVARKPKQIKRR